ncbi:MAG: rRNA pseudouridine synthase [Deltaproteobacteria bacterium]|nr:rRNA pseudouridine synthase [Deltaproteobacteria bacterium]
MPTERLHKVLAELGVASRRASERLISAGRVTVNRRCVTEMGLLVDRSRDRIAVDGLALDPQPQRPVYLLANKPDGMLSTARDDRGRRTVLDLVPEYAGQRLFMAGRLDFHSEGLILLTNDGELVHRLTHPSAGVPKTYRVKVRGEPDDAALERLRRGVHLATGHTRPAAVERIGRARVNTWLEITITEGRNREIRDMCHAVGYPVQRLLRVAIGSVELGVLRPGEVRPATRAEVMALRALVDLPVGPERVRRRQKQRVARRSQDQ